MSTFPPRLAAAGFSSVFLLAAGAAVEWGQELPEPRRVGTLPEPQIVESSGLVRSPAHPDVFWTLNDSGNPAQIYAVRDSGELLRTHALRAENHDWEDLAIDEKGRLLIADVGDNFRRRTELALYRCLEPDPFREPAAPLAVEVFLLKYPKEVGAQDCEAVIVRSGWACLFTKEKGRTRALRLPLPDPPPREAVTLDMLGETEAIGTVTAADLSADGRCLALLSLDKVVTVEYSVAFEKTGGAEGRPAPFSGTMRQRSIRLGQSEALAWDGADLVITTEQRGVFRIEKAR